MRVADILDNVCLPGVVVRIGRVMVEINRIERYVRIKDGMRTREYRVTIDPKYVKHVEAALRIVSLACKK